MALFTKKKADEAVIDQSADADGYVTVKDAAAQLGVYTSTIQTWFDEGLLSGFVTPKGGHRRISQSSIDKLKQRKTS